MESNWKTKLLCEIENGTICTDSDVEDFETEQGLNSGEAFHFLDVKNAEGTPCDGCKHIGMRPNMYPCNHCTRCEKMKDYYEKK